MRLLKRLSLIGLISLISSCAWCPPESSGRPGIILPGRPALPPLSAEQKEAIPLEVFLILVEREVTLEAYIEEILRVVNIYNEVDPD